MNKRVVVGCVDLVLQKSLGVEVAVSGNAPIAVFWTKWVMRKCLKGRLVSLLSFQGLK